MGLEQGKTTYCGETFTSYIGTHVSSRKDVAVLAQTNLKGDYFFGGVVDTGSHLFPFFAQGPDHVIATQIVQETFHIEGLTHTCIIRVDPQSDTITEILFREDPEKQEDNA